MTYENRIISQYKNQFIRVVLLYIGFIILCISFFYDVNGNIQLPLTIIIFAVWMFDSFHTRKVISKLYDQWTIESPERYQLTVKYKDYPKFQEIVYVSYDTIGLSKTVNLSKTCQLNISYDLLAHQLDYTGYEIDNGKFIPIDKSKLSVEFMEV